MRVARESRLRAALARPPFSTFDVRIAVSETAARPISELRWGNQMHVFNGYRAVGGLRAPLHLAPR